MLQHGINDHDLTLSYSDDYQSWTIRSRDTS